MHEPLCMSWKEQERKGGAVLSQLGPRATPLPPLTVSTCVSPFTAPSQVSFCWHLQSPPLSFSPFSAAWLLLLWKGPLGPWVNPGPLPAPARQEWGSPSPRSQPFRRVWPPSWQPAAITSGEAGGGKPGTWCIQVNSGPRAVRPPEGGSGSPENSVGVGARPTVRTPSSRPRVSRTHRVRQRWSRTLSIAFNPRTQVGVTICSENQPERTCQFKQPAGGRFQILDMLLGALPPSARTLWVHNPPRTVPCWDASGRRGCQRKLDLEGTQVCSWGSQ